MRTSETRLGISPLYDQRSSSYRHYLLAILSLVFAFNSTDRMALGMLLENIKRSLHLTDIQLGLLNGIAFALFYSVMGVPIGVLADRGDRVRIIAVTTAIWGVMVSLCAATTSFVQLLLVRVGVAVGESGCVPPSHSLLAEHFDRRDRARATAIFYSLSIILSSAIGYLFAGWMNQIAGWRITFLLVGSPGLVLAALTWMCLREPRRCRSIISSDTSHFHSIPPSSLVHSPHSVLRVCASLLGISTYRYLLIAFAIVSFFAYGIVQWQPSFYIRSYGISTGALGTWLTFVYGVGGAIGTLFGGDIASRFARGNERLQLAAVALIYVSFGVISVFIYLSPSYHVSIALLSLASVCGALSAGPLYGCIQTVVTPETRALSISLLYLAGNLIGMGLGPLAVGALSQELSHFVGTESLRYALAAMSPGYLIGGWYFWRSSKTVMRDIAAAAPNATSAQATT